MRLLEIYIASSWRNQHAVEMLTQLLEDQGHTVFSFVRNAAEDRSKLAYQDLDQWIESEDGRAKFVFDITAATTSDLVIYLGPSGCDAWAEVGAAYGRGVPVLGLWAKGEPVSLMRRLIRSWHRDFRSLISKVQDFAEVAEEVTP
jgi:hypothetical protein